MSLELIVVLALFVLAVVAILFLEIYLDRERMLHEVHNVLGEDVYYICIPHHRVDAVRRLGYMIDDKCRVIPPYKDRDELYKAEAEIARRLKGEILQAAPVR